MTTHTPLRLPETMTRADIGPYIRGVREYFGLSQQDVSEQLHIRHRYIGAIEEGKLEEMPGRAYAKGYVHTYAEFLGIDPDQVVEICFGPEPVREQQHHFVPAPARRKGAAIGAGSSQWRSWVGMAVVLAIFVLGVTQFFMADEPEQQVAPVAEVPEDMLSDVRTMVMPDSSNAECLGAATDLGCLFSSRTWQDMQQLLSNPLPLFAEMAYSPAFVLDKDLAPEADADDAAAQPEKPAPTQDEKPKKTHEKATPPQAEPKQDAVVIPPEQVKDANAKEEHKP